MISVSIEGVDSVIDAVRKIPAMVGSESAFASAAQEFHAILRAATPPGYNEKLFDSVLYSAKGGESVVGYDSRVETAGNAKFDKASRPTRRSVMRRWVPVDELESIFESAVDDNSSRLVSIIERSAADGIS